MRLVEQPQDAVAGVMASEDPVMIARCSAFISGWMIGRHVRGADIAGEVADDLHRDLEAYIATVPALEAAAAEAITVRPTLGVVA